VDFGRNDSELTSDVGSVAPYLASVKTRRDYEWRPFALGTETFAMVLRETHAHRPYRESALATCSRWGFDSLGELLAESIAEPDSKDAAHATQDQRRKREEVPAS
jgi:hypothetical protein